MSPWTAERRSLAQAAAQRFQGTPHRNRLCLPGEGVDCIRFVLAVLQAAEILPPHRLPFYDERLGAFRKRNVMEALFLSHLDAEGLPTDTPPEFGDVVICQCGRQTNHVGILLENDHPTRETDGARQLSHTAMWHVPGKGHVGPEAWEIWRPRAQSIVRIRSAGLRDNPGKLTWRQIKGMSDSDP
jgi:cell wall-associated NlpC family hydrolase